MYVWHVIGVADGHIELVDGWESLDALITNMAASAWEKPGNAWASYVTDDATGDIVAVPLFGPGLELPVTVSDGRLLRLLMPALYREQER